MAKVKELVVDIQSTTALETLADAINEAEISIAAWEDKIEPTIEKIKAKNELLKKLRAQMAEAMIAHSRHNVYKGGYQFTLKHNPPTFEILNPELALKWAQDHNCMTIDMSTAKTLLKREIMTPDGFIRVDKNTISRTAEQKNEEQN